MAKSTFTSDELACHICGSNKEGIMINTTSETERIYVCNICKAKIDGV